MIKLETRILQTEEYIKLLATKEYVDSETGAIYTKYDAELSVMAEEISARVTEEQFATAQEAITLANNAAKAAQTAADNAHQSVTDLNTYVDGAFADGIITEAEAKAIEKYLNTVNTSKDSVTATYTKLYSNTYLDGAAKTGLKSAKDVLDSSISALISSINTAIADGKTTASEKADVDKKFAAFNTAMSSFESAVETANKYIQDKLKDYTDTATNQVKVKLESDLSVQAGQITGISTRVDNIRNEIDTAGWINTTQGNTLFAAKSLEDGNKIISYINQTATTTTIKAERINLVGAVTFSMFNTSLQGTINGKANSSDLGDLAYDDYVSMSNLSSTLQDIINGKAEPVDITNALKPYVTSTQLSNSLKNYELTGVADDKVKDLINALTGKQSTTIINGYISTSLLDASQIYTIGINAQKGVIGGFTIGSNKLSSKMANGGTFSINPSGNITFEESTRKAVFGTNGHTSESEGVPFVSLIDDSSSLSTGVRVLTRASRSYALYASYNKHDTTSRRDIEIGFRQFSGDDSWFKRGYIRMTQIPAAANLGNPSVSYFLKWDPNSGIVFIS